tara:strand:+ start:628 stop:759 length:132 start_codon:yes stop_codon:yes gene_type:complete
LFFGGSVVGFISIGFNTGVVDKVFGRKPPAASASVVSDGEWAY